jgi:hypothetical protein
MKGRGRIQGRGGRADQGATPGAEEQQRATSSGGAALRKSGTGEGETREASSGDEGSVYEISGDDDGSQYDDGLQDKRETTAKKAPSKTKACSTAPKSQKRAKAASGAAKAPKDRVASKTASKTKSMRNVEPDGGNAATSTSLLISFAYLELAKVMAEKTEAFQNAMLSLLTLMAQKLLSWPRRRGSCKPTSRPRA